MTARKIVYFTDAYPFSRTEDWKARELVEFRDRFDEVVVAPLNRRSAEPADDFPRGVRVLEPLFDEAPTRSSVRDLVQLLGARAWVHLTALRDVRPSHCPGDLRRWALAGLHAERIFRHPTFRQCVAPEFRGSALYFFWGRGYAAVVPFLERPLLDRTIVRFHGHDLYWDRNEGFIPYQRAIVSAASRSLAVSHHGARYLNAKYPGASSKIVSQPLGTRVAGRSRPSTDGVFRLVSCAHWNPVKRLPLIPRCLAEANRRIDWTHIGEPSGFGPKDRMECSLPSNVTVRFVGSLAPREVSLFLAGEAFDLFVNVSESEGIPVAAMEAMAAGIPVLATDVGGTRELVDESVGALLPKDFSVREFLRIVDAFAELPPEQRDRIRERCVERIRDQFDAHTNAHRVVNLAIELFDRAVGR